MTASEQPAWVQQTSWPAREEDATADRLILHGARIATAMHAAAHVAFVAWSDTDRESPDHKPRMRRYLDALSAAIAESQVVIALETVQRTDREQADELARRLYELTEDGGVLPELMWDYLSDRGVDAQALWNAAEAEAAEHRNGSQS